MKFNREKLSWAAYDWANSAFATTVMAGFFPVFFKQYWSDGVEPSESTFWLGVANSAAAIVVALSAPILGAIADAGDARKKWLAAFMFLGVLSSISMYFIGQGQWWLAALALMFGTIGFAGGNSFYDSLLVDISPPEERGFLSTFGYAIGYLGGGLLFTGQVIVVLQMDMSALNTALITKICFFTIIIVSLVLSAGLKAKRANDIGLAVGSILIGIMVAIPCFLYLPSLVVIDDKTLAIKLCFVSVGVWWLLFSIPLFLSVKERQTDEKLPLFKAVTGGFTALKITFKKIRSYRNIWIFLIAFWLYIDGVHTIIKMAVDYGLALGFSSDSLIKALLVTQFIGFPAAIAYGWFGNKIGIRKAISVAILVYMGVTVWGMGLSSETEFYIMAGVIGLVQGGVQGLSRAYYSQLIPVNQSAEFFGFYNMLGKFAAVLGPMLMGTVTYMTGEPRYGIVSLIALFIGGLYMLSKVKDPDQQQPEDIRNG